MMPTETIIEISDTRVKATISGQELYAEPGIAWLPSGEKPVLGQSAQKLLRQQPTRIHSRYWSDVSTDPIQLNNTQVRHNADLVWHQLTDIKQQLNGSSVSLCVPSNISHAQMQLIAGICGSLELSVDYLINLGLAQLAAQEPTEAGTDSPITHLDLQLHQLVVSKYASDDSSLKLQSQEVFQGISFLKLIDRLLHCLRDAFIQSSRFDPLHSGDTEQQLFDQIVQQISTGNSQPFEITTDQKNYSIELGSQDFKQIIARFSEEVMGLVETSSALAFAPIFSHLPGFQLPEHGIAINDSDAVLGAAKLLGTQEPSEGTAFINQIRLGADSYEQESPNAINDSDDIEITAKSANAILFNGAVYGQNSLGQLCKDGFPESLVTFNNGELQVNPHQSTKVSINGKAHTENSPLTLSIKDEVQVEEGISATAVRLIDS